MFFSKNLNSLRILVFLYNFLVLIKLRGNTLRNISCNYGTVLESSSCIGKRKKKDF